jgi:hypothetical protein
VANTALISCDIDTTDSTAKLGLEIWLNNLRLLDLDHVTQLHEFTHVISDDDQNHELRFVLKNKMPAHTQIDQDHRIVKDACICVTNLKFDGIPLGQVFFEQAVYEHDYNGTASLTQEKFYGKMGCNGTVCLKFSTPIYMWLLENM